MGQGYRQGRNRPSAGAHADTTGAGRWRGPSDPPQATGDRPRLALPDDLAGSLRHLEDDQLKPLLRAANAEAERRGWKVPRANPRGPPRAGVEGRAPDRRAQARAAGFGAPARGTGARRTSRLDAAGNSGARRRPCRAFGQACIDPGRTAQRAGAASLRFRQRPLVACRRVRGGRRARSRRHAPRGRSGNRRGGRRRQARPVLVNRASGTYAAIASESTATSEARSAILPVEGQGQLPQPLRVEEHPHVVRPPR